MKKVIFLSLLSLAICFSFVGCDNTQGGDSSNTDAKPNSSIESPPSKTKSGNGYVIKGHASNLNANSQLLLKLVDLKKNLTVIDTALVQEDGTYEFSGTVAEKSVVNVAYPRSRNPIYLIIDNNSNVKLDFDPQDIRNYTLEGDAENKQLREFISNLQNRVYTSEQQVMNYADTVSSPYVGHIVTNSLKISDQNYDLFKKQVERMKKVSPNGQLTNNFAQYVASKAGLAKTKTGAVAPEIKLNSPEGKSIPLSSLKGKVVLLDFWASWCRPCRKENPTVVRAYDKYKSKGFEVYSVSLDKTKAKWEAAIEQDNLKWDAHVSDLQGWRSSAAALYGVTSIPQTFLLDQEGKIIAKNLRGSALEKKLAELLGS